jgi:TctA family transporter
VVTRFLLAQYPLPCGWNTFGNDLLGASWPNWVYANGTSHSFYLILGSTTPNALFDGYPLAQQGQAKTAIGCSAAASALGSTFGVLALILLIPVMRETILAFGPSELLMLTIWGLTTIAVLIRRSVIRGLIAAGLGLLISFMGFDPRTAELRYTFGSLYLRDGLSLVPVFIGFFAITEVIKMTVSNRRTISGQTRMEELTGNVWEGVKSIFQHFGLFIRSSILGTVIGAIPGIGATVASFVAYGQAVQTARKNKENFGRGDLRGVLAPEAANDAKDGGSLVPTLAFGIPGGTGTALLLAALGIHGIIPGREMMTSHLSLVFVLIWSMFLSNWLTSIVGVTLVNPIARLTIVPFHLLVPFIFVLATLGVYVYKGRIEDVIIAYTFGILGYYMKCFGWPRIPLVIALVLGPLFENSLRLTMKLNQLGRINFWTQPIAMTLLVLTITSLALPYVNVRRTNKPKDKP